MPLICLPISHLLEDPGPLRDQLLNQAQVLELRHPIKPDFLPEKPLIFHWNLGVIQEGFIPGLTRDGIGPFLIRAGVQLFSFDLGPACRRNQHILPMSRTMSAREIVSEAGKALNIVRRFHSGSLAVENYNYYPTGMYTHVCRPDFIGHFLEKLNLGLVLDLAHAAISAANLDLPLDRYLGELPLDRVVAIHISRPYFHPKIAVDAHAGPQDDDFRLLAWVLERTVHPDQILISIEYYRDIKRLADHYRTLEETLVALKKGHYDSRSLFCQKTD